MAEDVNLQVTSYDEDLCENPFFKYMQTKQKQLYEEAARKRWTICIPRQGTQARGSFTPNHVENHILQPVEGKPLAYKTANNKEVQVRGEFIVTTEGFEDVKSVRILFEETFFNSNNQSFSVLCIEQPLEGGIGGSLEPAVMSLDTLQACSEFLWNSTGGKHTEKQHIDDILTLFNSSYEQLEGESLRHLMDAAHAIYTRTMQAALKNAQLRKLAQLNSSYMDNVKLAIETYVMDKLHGQLFKGISSIVGKEDALLNKTTRNLAEIQIKDLGVKEQLRVNLPRGRRALSFLNRYNTPLEKFHALKKAVTIVTDRKMKTPDDTAEAITVDDLLPALIFLVIKSGIPNWLANITYLHNFHFSKRGQNEFQFFLSSIEAAVEHIRGGYVNDILKGLPPAKMMSSPRLVMETDEPNKATALEKLFEFASNGDEEQVEKLLSSGGEPGSPGETFCHPLCSCDKCETLHTRKRHDPSAVTVFSRDDLGRTVLHVASEYGNANLLYKLIKRGAVVNAMDYHGTTALHLACQKGHDSAALVLMHYKADVNAPDNDGNTALHLCTANGHEKCTKAMIFFDMKVNVMKVNAANEQGDTPLHLASRWGYVEIVRLLLEKGASLEARNKDKATPLDSSLDKQVTEILLEAVAAASEEQEQTISYAERTNSISERPLIQSQEFPNPVSKDQERAKEIDRFIHTVADGDVELVRYKLSPSDDEEDEEDSGEQPRSDQDLCHPLCQCDKCSKWQKRSLEAAVKIIHPNVRNAEGMTALHIAAIRGYEEMTNLLLRRGAETDVKNYTQMRAPLHFACQYNHPRVAGLLLSHQAKVNVKDYKGNTPLHLCCFSGHLDPAAVLIGHGAGVNVTNDRGNTPLHEAARFNLVKLVILLLENGASVTVRNKRELTPLQYAHRDDVIRALDQAEGISFNARTKKLSYSGYKSHNPGHEKQNASSPKNRSNSIPAYVETNAVNKHPLPVTSPSSSARTAPLRNETGDGSLAPHERLNKLFERLERGDVERLQDISKAVKSFDRRTSLRRTETIDKSSPLIDLQLKHQLSIQHFDRSSLRKVETREHSKPAVKEEKDYEGDVSSEDDEQDAT